ncbi:10603_t:CDS:2, partial [Acaulospora colombiana]
NNSLVRWATLEEEGFAQPNFSYKCEGCQVVFDKPSLGIRRFAEEDSAFHRESLLHHSTGVINTTSANEFMTKILSVCSKFYTLDRSATNERSKYLDGTYKVNQPIAEAEIRNQADELAKGLSYSPKLLLENLQRGVAPLRVPDPANPRPSHFGPASIDLVGAIIRQGSFIEKMVGLGWTKPGRFDHSRDSSPLVRCIARYHAFLDIMSQSSGLFLVPTLDLAWHTHQLKGDQYRLDTQYLLQRTPNHDDNVDATSLSTAYDITAKAWKVRFGVPYSVCGCIPDKGPESRTSRFSFKLSSFGHKREKSNTRKEGMVVNSRPDLVSTEDHEADTSHPSEHNAYFGNPSGQLAQWKKEYREKKSMQCVASAKKEGARDPWNALQAERAEKRHLASLDGTDGNRGRHREAFTDPYYGYGYYYPYWGAVVGRVVGRVDAKVGHAAAVEVMVEAMVEGVVVAVVVEDAESCEKLYTSLITPIDIPSTNESKSCSPYRNRIDILLLANHRYYNSLVNMYGSARALYSSVKEGSPLAHAQPRGIPHPHLTAGALVRESKLGSHNALSAA